MLYPLASFGLERLFPCLHNNCLATWSVFPNTITYSRCLSLEGSLIFQYHTPPTLTLNATRSFSYTTRCRVRIHEVDLTSTKNLNSVKPFLKTSCIYRPPVYKDHILRVLSSSSTVNFVLCTETTSIQRPFSWPRLGRYRFYCTHRHVHHYQHKKIYKISIEYLRELTHLLNYYYLPSSSSSSSSSFLFV